MSSITITTQSFGAINSTVTGQAPATITLELGTPGPQGIQGPAGSQGPAGPAFTGGPITSAITYGVGTYTTVFENGDIYTEDTSSGAYGVVYINGIEASDGSNTITMSASGIQFPDSTFQSTAGLTDAPSDGTIYGRQNGSWVTAGGGSYLPLAGGTMTGPIVFDGTSGQYISKGNFDTARGGNYGISLVCSIGYEFNWQAGWLTTTNQGSVTPRPLYLDSLAGTTLRAWDSATDNGVEVAHTGINVANASPYYVNVAPDTLKVFESTNELGVTIAHDSIAIQHIDTPNVTGYVTNEYIGFEDLGGSPHSAFVEHDVITVQDESNTTQMRSTGISLSAEGSITFGDSTVQTTAYTGGFITSVSSPLAVTSGDLSIDLTGYAPLAGATFTGRVFFNSTDGNVGVINLINNSSPTSPSDGDIWYNGSELRMQIGASARVIATQSWVTSQSYLTTSTASSTYAPKASPALTGTPTSTTAAVDTNTTQIATTAYVVGQAASATPIVDGTAAVGTSLRYARADHVHPTDTSRAPLASPTFTGTVTIPAGASISGFAPLASPTFTGTPTLPTGTIATTQTAGNNTTAVATTAFVTAAVPAFATETEAIVGTSSTTVINPLQMRNILANAGYTAYTSLAGNYSSYVSGSASVATLWSNFVGLSVTAANGKIAFMPNSNGTYHPFTSRGKAELNLDCTKPTWFSFRFNYSSSGGIGDSNTVNRVTIGKVSSYFGDLTTKGFGVKWTAGTSGAFTVMAHNGTTLTTVASAVTVSNTTYFPTTSSAADFLVYSDGAGNITLYCNGVQVATTTGGPSSGTIVGSKFVFEADNTTSTSGNVLCDYTGIRSMYSY